MNAQTYRDLDVWRVSMEVAKRVYRSSLAYPSVHRIEIGGQMRRAAVSVPSNIAEGYRQRSRRSYLRYLNVSAGSNSELDTQLELLRALGIGDPQDALETAAMNDRVGRMLNVLISRIEGESGA